MIIMGKDMCKHQLSFLVFIWGVFFVMSVGVAEIPQEDCIPFNSKNIEVKNINGRWKIVEGKMWMLDFKANREEAEQAFQVIKHYGYTHQCFVGRPAASMTYWKKVSRTQHPTTVFVVRHAEKDTTPSANPPLTTTGEKRAKSLAQILMKSGVSAIYSTNYTRTKETVNNTGVKLGLPVRIYQTPSEVAALVKNQHVGDKILVAGHSNTVPQILTALGVHAPPTIGNQFNNLFVVEISSEGSTNLTHLQYEVFQNSNVLKRIPLKMFEGSKSK